MEGLSLEELKKQFGIKSSGGFSLSGVSSGTKKVEKMEDEENKKEEQEQEDGSEKESSMEDEERGEEDENEEEEQEEELKKKEELIKEEDSIDINEKRKHYRCGSDFVTINDIPTWKNYFLKENIKKSSEKNLLFQPNDELNQKISIHYGDITSLEIDGVVNAANRSLMGGGGIDGAIHSAAGRKVYYACRSLNGCDTGNTKVTKGFRLPAKYILHTVGPTRTDAKKLKSCYRTCLKRCLEYNIRTVAFCCISTGIYGYPLKEATQIALRTCRVWLEKHSNDVDRIIFCVFLPIEKEMYEFYVPRYFPLTENETEKVPVQPSKPPKKKRRWFDSDSSDDEEDDN